MRKTFVMRGKIGDFKASGAYEVLNFGKYKQGYAYRLTEFKLFSSEGIGSTPDEMCAAITAGKTPADPEAPDFNDEGLIGNVIFSNGADEKYGPFQDSVINDTYIITQNLLLTATDNQGASGINYQCRFESVKMTGAEEASVNYKQFAISDE
jgi:hypothetical protein